MSDSEDEDDRAGASLAAFCFAPQQTAPAAPIRGARGGGASAAATTSSSTSSEREECSNSDSEMEVELDVAVQPTAEERKTIDRDRIPALLVGDAHAGRASDGTASATAASSSSRPEQYSDSEEMELDHAEIPTVEEVEEAEAFANDAQRDLTPALLNYGMPLALAAGVPIVRLDQRYLLPSSVSASNGKDGKSGKSEAGDGRMLTALLRTFGFRTLGIRSPMGTGKTEAYFSYLTAVLQRFPELRVLLITARLTLTASLQMRAAESDLGFLRYNEVAGLRNHYLQKHSRVIVQLDSLLRLIPSGRSAAMLPFDIVLLDEGESTLMHMSASSMARNADVWKCFQNICNNCTQLIALDADLGSRLQWMLEHFHQRTKEPVMVTSAQSQGAEFARLLGATVVVEGSPAVLSEASPGASQTASLEASPGASLEASSSASADHHAKQSAARAGMRLIVNGIKTDRRRYVRIQTEIAFYRRLRTLLEKGERVVIPVNLKVSALAIERFIKTHYPDREVLTYHALTDAEQKAKSAYCNREWIKYDVVIYTPTIVYGVDFNPPEPHFHCILAWGVRVSNPVREFTQMLGRVRRLINEKVYVYTPEFLSSRNQLHPPPDLLQLMREKLEDDILHDWNRLNRAGTLDPMLRQEVGVGGKLQVQYHDPVYRELYIRNELERRLSAKHFVRLFWHAVNERIVDMDQLLPDPADDAEVWPPSLEAQIQETLELDARATQQFLQDCAVTASAVEADPKATAERARRFQTGKTREEDHPYRTFVELRSMYHLQQLSTTAPPTGQQRIAMTALVRYHGDRLHREFFERFCRVNSTQGCLIHQWTSAASDQQRIPLRVKEARTVSEVHLLKGLLAMVGFVRQAPSAAHSVRETADPSSSSSSSASSAVPASSTSSALSAFSSPSASSAAPSNEPVLAAWDPCAADTPMQAAALGVLASPISGRAYADVHDTASLEPHIATADVCSNLSVDTTSVRERLENPTWHAWLRETKQLFEDCGIQFRDKATYDVEYVTKLLDRTLRRLVGFGLVRIDSKRRREAGPGKKSIRRKVTHWHLESDFRDSMLELAYSLSTSVFSSPEHRLLGDWTVAQTVAAWKPPFRWHLLTGIEAASCGASVFAAAASAAASADADAAAAAAENEEETYENRSLAGSLEEAPVDDDEDMMEDPESHNSDDINHADDDDQAEDTLAVLDAQTKCYSNGMIDSHTRHLTQQKKKRKLEAIHGRSW